ncbi:uncharacterized protein LOC102574909 [Alligator mississippiensis]|uniref:uncharacterized protein LOC102574909 n=1 Tax=Alligator mississippiensis TaxID=8496 RepID=UPI002877BB45|nr:uncharacterized protein LOC102574909 [Alligator mississippiensis]
MERRLQLLCLERSNTIPVCKLPIKRWRLENPSGTVYRICEAQVLVALRPRMLEAVEWLAPLMQEVQSGCAAPGDW